MGFVWFSVVSEMATCRFLCEAGKKQHVCVCVCVCEREREREREKYSAPEYYLLSMVQAYFFLNKAFSSIANNFLTNSLF